MLWEAVGLQEASSALLSHPQQPPRPSPGLWGEGKKPRPRIPGQVLHSHFRIKPQGPGEKRPLSAGFWARELEGLEFSHGYSAHPARSPTWLCKSEPALGPQRKEQGKADILHGADLPGPALWATGIPCPSPFPTRTESPSSGQFWWRIT